MFIQKRNLSLKSALKNYEVGGSRIVILGNILQLAIFTDNKLAALEMNERIDDSQKN